MCKVSQLNIPAHQVEDFTNWEDSSRKQVNGPKAKGLDGNGPRQTTKDKKEESTAKPTPTRLQ